MSSLDIDHLRVELGVERVMDTYGLRGTKRNGWFRLKQCPRCHETSSREAIAIEHSTGRWLHHGRERSAGGDCSGDLFDLVAACEGLDPRQDYGKVFKKAREIAGSAASDPELDKRVRERLEQSARLEQIDREERERAALSAADFWESLSANHHDGELYLTRRGLDPYSLKRTVRYASNGDVCVALYSPNGRVTSVARRRLDPKAQPKVLVRKGTTTQGTMVDTIDSINHRQIVVLVEGLIDALTARIAWPTATVLGSNGAGNLARIAALAVPRIKLAHTSLWLVPHEDEPGIRAMTAAAIKATAAGFELGRELHIVDLPEDDLNAAWCAGWRFSQGRTPAETETETETKTKNPETGTPERTA